MDKKTLKQAVCETIERRADDIVAVSEYLMRNPETGFREVKASKRVAQEFEKMQIPYESGLALTGVKARMRGGASDVTVGVLGELDALLVSGHPYEDPETHAAPACGHHAQVASMLGAGIGVQPFMDQLDGDVVLFAVPAEEGIEVEHRLGLVQAGKIEFIVGKAELIRLGAFDDIDMAMITHTNDDPKIGKASGGDSHNGCLIKYVRFEGRASHGADPQEGINALKAATIALSAIDAQRETFKEDELVRIHPIITKGGEAVSIVPADVRIETFVRGRTVEAMKAANEKVDRALRAGALAIGARVFIKTVPGYLPHQQDSNLLALWRSNAAALVGEENMGRARSNTGSTDVGDLFHIMPTVHPRTGGVEGISHGKNYVVVDQYLACVVAAKAMAMTVVDLLSDQAKEAKAVLANAGPKLSKNEYLNLRRSFAQDEWYPA